jgi:hypothetical protein
MYADSGVHRIHDLHLLDNDVAVEISNEHEILRNKLVRHLDMQYLNGKLRWLRI